MSSEVQDFHQKLHATEKEDIMRAIIADVQVLGADCRIATHVQASSVGKRMNLEEIGWPRSIFRRKPAACALNSMQLIREDLDHSKSHFHAKCNSRLISLSTLTSA